MEEKRVWAQKINGEAVGGWRTQRPIRNLHCSRSFRPRDALEKVGSGQMVVLEQNERVKFTGGHNRGGPNKRMID